MTPAEARYGAETRTSEELAKIFLAEGWDTDTGIHAAVTLHFRGGADEFEIGRRWANSPAAAERAAGADVLGQLGWERKTFQRESVAILIALLSDPDIDVICSAAYALGHRNDPRAITPLIPLASHFETAVRRAVVSGLSRHDDHRAVCTLIELSQDTDDDVRNWASFGIAQQIDLDTPALRDALALRLADHDPEIRGEAMIGLGRRGDSRALPAVKLALQGEFHGDWPLEAAGLIGAADLVPLIRAHRETLEPEDRATFASSFDSALRNCGEKS